MEFEIKRLDGGPKWTVVAGGFPRLGAAYAWVIDMATKHGERIVDIDRAKTHMTVMVSNGDEINQFEIMPAA